jgi:hypothetical protein
MSALLAGDPGRCHEHDGDGPGRFLRRGRLVFALRAEQHSPSEPSDFHRPHTAEPQGLVYWQLKERSMKATVR